MAKEPKNLEKELYALEITFIQAVKSKDPKQEELWRKYQNTRIEYIKSR